MPRTQLKGQKKRGRPPGSGKKAGKKAAPDKQEKVAKKGGKLAVTVFKGEETPEVPKWIKFPNDPLDFLKNIVHLHGQSPKRLEGVKEDLYVLITVHYDYIKWTEAIKVFSEKCPALKYLYDLHNNGKWGVENSPVLNPEVNPKIVGHLKEEELEDWFDFLETCKGIKEQDISHELYVGGRGHPDTDLAEYVWGAYNNATGDVILPEANVEVWKQYRKQQGKKFKSKKCKSFNPQHIEVTPMAKKIPGLVELLTHLKKEGVTFNNVSDYITDELLTKANMGPLGFEWKDNGKKGKAQDYILAQKGKKGKKDEESSEEESESEESGSGSEESGSESASGSEESSESGSGSEEESESSESGSEEESEESGSGSEEESESSEEESEESEEESEESDEKPAKGKKGAKGKAAKGKKGKK